MTSRERRRVDEHLADVLALVVPSGVVEVPLDVAPGHVLARDVASRLDAPAADVAAMDGFAVRAVDVAHASPPAPVTLRVVADVPAGSGDVPRVGPGEAARIMTGAPLPPGCDAVVPVEATSAVRFAPGAGAPAHVTLPTAEVRRDHVRPCGEDLRRGDVVLTAGTVLAARHVSVAASAGHGVLPVHRPPRVAVLSTGSELVPAGVDPGPGSLPDSNSVLLAAVVRSRGAHVVRRGAVGDTPQALAAALDDVALSSTWPDGVRAPADLVVTTGGVSAGAFDVVRALLDPAARAGTPWAGAVDDDRLVAVGMQPGRPQGLARWRGVPWLALPGNPVSAFVSSELFVGPVVDRLRGVPDPRPALVTRVAGEGWPSPAGREQLVLVRHAGPDDARVLLASRATGGRGSGSHRVSALAHADAVAVVPADVSAVGPGDAVRVLLLR
ncbi:molybdopterin molybdotransferase MoeA [Cellulosimicrobium marinum]|uniref:molybdopterin molybdotransferase MoeA n=1 Tax=Cellulosimicrobium marinum TaxID=1638992 RepID=UPI001E51EC36|nr:gephyrin-like molybdotransferase Glp [Cellulosimicrobium marinum]MCB7136106.1 molybdopterin molybdotransferase MoeA [Cellulosimicrobium marinum]